ncbi:MAG: DUF192 domain-containing protein [Deltaproteobacteria bacterium]|nr:DUF192 domain-containing protein [Deltaproteobacteria bacterium]
MKTFVILLAFILIIPACMQEQHVLIIHSATVDHQVKVEVVTKPADQAQGLMYRRSLDKDSGMLFIFRQEEPQSFWMKNTLIPLDMIFISRDLVIVDIATMQPCITDPCPDYTSRQPAQYVLEVNAGYCRSHHITIGDKISSAVIKPKR